MNILYVVDTFSVIEPLGVLQLSAITKEQGHKSFAASIADGDVDVIFKKNNIDVVAFSFMTTEMCQFHALSKHLRQLNPDIHIIAGGSHPTYYPDIVDDWPIDAVIIGEGDLSFPEVLDCLENGKDFSHVSGVHTKKRKNETRHLVEDLDSLPFFDRELLSDKNPYKYIRMKSFFGTRGCPYRCSYCFNSAYNTMFKGKGSVLRRRSAESIVTEIEQVVKNYPTDFIRFGDDTFVMEHDQWVDEFCEKYKKRVGLPFYFLIHPNLVNHGLIKVLKDAGCHSAMMGIESADAELRRKVLDRYVTDETIQKAFKIMKDFDVKVFSNTILGLPSGNAEIDLKSLNFTLDCAPTYSGFTVFTPFPGTELYRYSKENGYLDEFENSLEEIIPTSMQSDSCLKHVSERQKEIHKNIILLGPIANALPALRKLIVNHLIYWKPNKFFKFIAFFVRNYLTMQIFPFRKSPLSFFHILKKVIKIDKHNYASKSPQVKNPQTAPVTEKDSLQKV